MIGRTMLLFILALAVTVDATAAQGPTVEEAPSPDLDAVVQMLVGEEWGVAPSAIVLEWSVVRDEVVSSADVELVGTGARGSFVVRVADGHKTHAIRVRAGTSVSRPIAARRLPRGTVLSGSDIEFGSATSWGPPQAEDDIVAPGWVAQRTLARGDRLVTPAVRPALSVTSGSPVEIVWRRGTIALALPGTAAGNGTVGELVFVRSESGKRMRGIIVAPGVVDVTRGASSNQEEGR